MIILTYEPLDVGEIITANYIEGERMVATKQPFLIVRESSFEEYRDSHSEVRSTATWRHTEGCFYYEVLTD